MIKKIVRERALALSRFNKQIVMVFTDFWLFFFSIFLALCIVQGSLFITISEQIVRMFSLSLLGVLVFTSLGIYRSIVRYIEFSAIYKLVLAICLVFIINYSLITFFGDSLRTSLPFAYNSTLEISLQDRFIEFLTSIILIIGSRLFANAFFSDHSGERRVVIYGAGSAGMQLSRALEVSKEMRPIGFLDDNKSLQGTLLGGIRVFSLDEFGKLIEKNKVDEVLFAIPSASKSSLVSALKEIEKYSVKVRILPGVAELAQGKVLVSELKEVDILDLLGREEVEPQKDLIEKNIKGKVVLVTGAGGSIGSELSRQVIKNDPKKLILVDFSEIALYLIKNELEELDLASNITSFLLNVTNIEKVEEICKSFKVQTIYHAAAYKHVPIVEENPFEAVSNNVFGTLNAVKAAINSKVETFVFISTDKAVRPTNIKGATKRFSEMILQSLAAKKDITKETRIAMVRFGNVLGSSGSAIPLFKQQIKEGGPLTVTDPEVMRYFMSIPEAAELVIQAGSMGQGGDLFVLDMGEPVQILDLAKRLINLSGKEIKDEKNPEGDIEIIFTGLRHGEKLFEELLIGDKVKDTQHRQIFVAKEEYISWRKMEEYLSEIKEALLSSDHTKLRDIFLQTVSGFKPENDIVDAIYLEKNKTP